MFVCERIEKIIATRWNCLTAKYIFLRDFDINRIKIADKINEIRKTTHLGSDLLYISLNICIQYNLILKKWNKSIDFNNLIKIFAQQLNLWTFLWLICIILILKICVNIMILNDNFFQNNNINNNINPI